MTREPPPPAPAAGVRRILQVAGSMELGGIQSWLMDVLRGIDRSRYRIDFLVETGREAAHDAEIRALGSRVIPCLEPRRPWRYARHFAAALAAHGPYDVVHSHSSWYGGWVMRLADRHGVGVRVAHSHNDRRGQPDERGVYRGIYRGVMRRLIRRHATARLAVSREAAEDLFGLDWAADPDTRLLPCGLDFRPFARCHDRALVRGELGLPADALVVGHVGRFLAQKNHAFLLEVAREAMAREPRLWLLLIGEGPLLPAMREKAAALGIAPRVVFTGGRDDVPRLVLGAMDAFLFPSLHEGLGLVLLEAQAAGLPCLVADTVPRLADVVGPLIHRLPLAAPAGEWARSLLAVAGRRPVTRAAALALLEASPLAVGHSIARLCRIYDGLPARLVLPDGGAAA